MPCGPAEQQRQKPRPRGSSEPVSVPCRLDKTSTFCGRANSGSVGQGRCCRVQNGAWLPACFRNATRVSIDVAVNVVPHVRLDLRPTRGELAAARVGARLICGACAWRESARNIADRKPSCALRRCAVGRRRHRRRTRRRVLPGGRSMNKRRIGKKTIA